MIAAQCFAGSGQQLRPRTRSPRSVAPQGAEKFLSNRSHEECLNPVRPWVLTMIRSMFGHAQSENSGRQRQAEGSASSHCGGVRRPGSAAALQVVQFEIHKAGNALQPVGGYRHGRKTNQSR